MSTATSTVIFTESGNASPSFYNVQTVFTGTIQNARCILDHSGGSYYEAYIEMLSGTTDHPVKTMMTAIVKGKQAEQMIAEYLKDPHHIPLMGHFKVSNMTTRYIQGENGIAEPVLVGILLSLVFQDNAMQNKYGIAAPVAPASTIPTLPVKNETHETQATNEVPIKAKDAPFERNTNLVKKTPAATSAKGVYDTKSKVAHDADDILIRGLCQIPALIVGSLFLYLLL